MDQAGVTDEGGIASTVLRIGPPGPYEIVDVPANGYEAALDERYPTRSSTRATKTSRWLPLPG